MKIGNRRLNHWLWHGIQVNFNLCFHLCSICSRQKSKSSFYEGNNFKLCLTKQLLNMFKPCCEWGIRPKSLSDYFNQSSFKCHKCRLEDFPVGVFFRLCATDKAVDGSGWGACSNGTRRWIQFTITVWCSRSLCKGLVRRKGEVHVQHSILARSWLCKFG